MDQDDSDIRADRRRRTWSARMRRDGQHDPVARIHPDAALSLMWSLARDAWLLADRELPSYERSDMPGRILRDERRR